MSLLHLVRHGRSIRNAAGELSGRADVALDDEGRAQARAVAVALGHLDRPRVVASPLARARQTADALGLAVEIDERWIELDYGEFEGRRMSDLPADVWSRWRADIGFTPPGGESIATLGARVREACEGLRAADRDVVVVSHVSPIKAAVAWALGVGDEVSWRLRLSTASITIVDLRGPALVGWNGVDHLASGGAP